MKKCCEDQSAALPCFDNPMQGCLHRVPAFGGALHLGLLTIFSFGVQIVSCPLGRPRFTRALGIDLFRVCQCHHQQHQPYPP
jgi:hypothetical protein